MIPLWMYPLACVLGNTYVLKPSERVPLTSIKLMEFASKAGFPPGVVNLIHGTHESVNFICDHPEIKAISFVGSNAAGEHIYKRGSHAGKRVQCNMAAKNHACLLPDAPREHALNAIAGAAFGAAGQRCMALSVVVLVGDAKEWVRLPRTPLHRPCTFPRRECFLPAQNQNSFLPRTLTSRRRILNGCAGGLRPRFTSPHVGAS